MKNRSEKLLILSTLFLLIFSATINSQETTVDDEAISVDTLLLNVPVIVGKRDGSYLNGLKKENFYIVENGVKRPIDFFADDAAPLNVAILIDASGSTIPILGDIKDAARDFIKILRPEDKAMIASFDTTTQIWSEFSSDQKKLATAIGKIGIGGGSVMNDTMYLLMKKYFAPLKGRKAIIVLTDGMVGGRGVSDQILLKSLAESDIVVYPLIFGDRLANMESKNPKDSSERLENFLFTRMNQLSLTTGGKIFFSKDTDFKTTFQNIAEELKKQYIIGFYPTNGKGEKSFKVGLQLDPKLYSLQNTVLRTKKTIRLKSPPKKKAPETNSGIQNN